MKKRFAIPMLVLSSTLILGGLTACNEPSTSVASKQNFTGIGIPSDALGNDGDTYKDESSGDIYVKEDGHWVIKQVAKALSGEGAPSDTLGNDGDNTTLSKDAELYYLLIDCLILNLRKE